MTSITIVPAVTDEELAANLQVAATVHPGAGVTVATLRHELVARDTTVFLLARVDGEPAGAGTGKASSMGNALFAMARVLPRFRRMGVGSALLAGLSDHARRVERSPLVGRVLEDDGDARSFLEHRGFKPISRECPVALDLGRTPTERPVAPADIEIVSLAERPDLAPAAHAVEVETIADVPTGSELMTPRSFEAWHADSVDAPDALPALSLVALADDRVVGWTGLSALAEEGVAENQLTGVLHAWRGRGIATALKQEQAWRARQAGLRRIETTNDEVNGPMRAVNVRLGFEPEPVWLSVQGPLVGNSR